jgi:hypothetical protein
VGKPNMVVAEVQRGLPGSEEFEFDEYHDD